MRIKPFLSSLAVLALTGCGGSGSSQPTVAAPAVIAIDGSSTVFPITEAVAEEFQKANPGARVTVGLSGTGGGFQKFCRGETAISNASRPIHAAEIDACQKAGVDLHRTARRLRRAGGRRQPEEHLGDVHDRGRTEEALGAEAQGKITALESGAAGWPDQEIHLFGAGVDSGTFDYFTEVINGKAKVSRGDYTSSEDDNILVQGVAGDQYALGYMGLAYYEENQGKMKLVAIDDEKPTTAPAPSLPSVETVRGGTYRPLSRPLFIYVSTTALARPEVQKFVEFYVDSAGRSSRKWAMSRWQTRNKRWFASGSRPKRPARCSIQARRCSRSRSAGGASVARPMNLLSDQRRRWAEFAIERVLFFCAAASVLVTGGIIAVLLVRDVGLPAGSAHPGVPDRHGMDAALL